MGHTPKPMLKPCTACGASPHHMGPSKNCCDHCEHPLANRQTWLGRFAEVKL